MAVQSPYLELSQESADRFCSFVLDGGYGDVPEAVLHRARLQLLDLIGVAASSIQTPLSRIIRDHAVAMFGAGNRQARILFDGRGVSPAGAAMAGGMSIDAVDALIGYAFGDLGLDLIVGWTASGNRRVERLARWFGASLVGRRDGPEWIAGRPRVEVEWALPRAGWRQAEGRRQADRS